MLLAKTISWKNTNNDLNKWITHFQNKQKARFKKKSLHLVIKWSMHVI